MEDRYVISIQNPKYSYEVFVWDRKEKRVLVSYPYSSLSPDDQRIAMELCKEWIELNVVEAL